MPILQLIKEYRFDLTVADYALSDNECKLLARTFRQSVPKGRGNDAIELILNTSIVRKIAIRHSKNSTHADFQQYLQYLQKRADS